MRTRLILILILFLSLTPLVEAQICDLVEMDSISTPGAPTEPLIFERFAYVPSGTPGITLINIEDPEALTVEETVSTRGEALDVALDYLARVLIVADGNLGVGTYAIEGNGSLSEIGTTDLGDLISSLDGSSGRFFAGGPAGILHLLGVTADAAPTVTGSVTLDGPINDLVVRSRKVYCAVGEAGLAVVSTENAEDLEVIEELDLGGPVLSVSIFGDTLYCGVEGIGIVAVHVDGDELTLAGSLGLPDAPVDLIPWNGRLFAAAPSSGIFEADISLSGDPLLLAELQLAGANGQALIGQTLFVTRGTSGFSSIDISDCANAGVEPVTPFVPAAAKAQGGFNSDWLTDVAIANLSAATASFNISYIVKGQANLQPMNVSVVLDAAEQLFVRDVFATLFGLEAANGALRIVASHPDVKISTRTYNAAGEEGTYGQHIPAFTKNAALTPGKVACLLQLQQNSAFRTNIGLMNVTLQPVEVEVQLYRGGGELVGIVKEELDGGEMTQIDQIFSVVGAGRVDNGYALVTVLTEGGAVLSYASVADNGSNDAVYISSQILSYEIEFSP